MHKTHEILTALNAKYGNSILVSRGNDLTVSVFVNGMAYDVVLEPNDFELPTPQLIARIEDQINDAVNRNTKMKYRPDDAHLYDSQTGWMHPTVEPSWSMLLVSAVLLLILVSISLTMRNCG